MKEIIKKIIVENQEINVEPKKREFQIPTTKKIVTLIGPRRVGKSYLFFHYINNLKKTIEKQKILLIDFDDGRLLPLDVSKLDLIMEAYYELYPEYINKTIYVFFDEIQNVTNWEYFVRRIYNNSTISLFLTGSSSKLLSKEIATTLRGRTISYSIYPLSFREFLYFKGVELNKESYYSSQRFEIKSYFNEFVEYGGFPEILDETLKIKILQSYLEHTLYKDLVERYNIRNIHLLKNLLNFLLNSISKEFSISSYYKSISKEIKTSRETIYEYLSYLEDSNVIYFLYKFDYSLKRQQSSKKKVYSIDTGFVTSNSFNFSQNNGKLLENIVFIELKRNELEIYYHKEKQECDFIIKQGKKITKAIQVTYSLGDEKTRKREVDGLVEACKIYGLNRGLILTQDEEEEFIEENIAIQVIPIWKWLLQEDIKDL